ncbi:hypothetical protein [Sphaerobacter thermophilus]|uniref:hypothetical protein n=1 Tax=Sphaerobacter thermophilus TaxID=2057 RepID=UPI0039C36EE0
MRPDDTRATQQPEPGTLPGKVLMAGVGFMVTGAAWALLSFFRSVDNEPTLVWLNAALLVIHLATGGAVLLRLPFAWIGGLLVVLAGIGGAVANDYFFVVVPELITGLILFLSRAEMQRPHSQASEPR